MSAAPEVPGRAPLKIAVDAMGGDYAPREVIKGALEFARSGDAEVLLVGDPQQIEPELASLGASGMPQVRVVPASQVIAMGEHPTQAVHEKPESSLVVCARLASEGKADATFSAGNTGAVMYASIRYMDRISGIRRPAIATMFPTETGGRAVVVDSGANVDCKASHLVQFALLGSVYAQKVLGVERPRVGLLANGEEETKGDDLTREVHALLSVSPLNFIGNVEGNHVFEGGVDVVVCDGFVGNVLLKGAEGTVRLVLSLLSSDAKRAQDETVRDALLKSLLRLRQQVDYSEYGGAPLLGVNGVSFIAHGRSDSRAIATGLREAANAARSGYVEAVRAKLPELKAPPATEAAG